MLRKLQTSSNHGMETVTKAANRSRVSQNTRVIASLKTPFCVAVAARTRERVSGCMHVEW